VQAQKLLAASLFLLQLFFFFFSTFKGNDVTWEYVRIGWKQVLTLCYSLPVQSAGHSRRLLPQLFVNSLYCTSARTLALILCYKINSHFNYCLLHSAASANQITTFDWLIITDKFRVCRWLSSGLQRRVVWYKFPDVSHVLGSSNIRGKCKHIWNVGKLTPDYTEQRPRRRPSSYSLL
jgi:hypothetical protein